MNIPSLDTQLLRSIYITERTWWYIARVREVSLHFRLEKNNEMKTHSKKDQSDSPRCPLFARNPEEPSVSRAIACAV